MNKLYFAYGSNLNLVDWQQWCDERGFADATLHPVGIAMMPDYELHFSRYSKRRGGGALNIRPSIGRVVEGVLFKADDITWQALDRKEGAPSVYEATDVTVLGERGVPVKATTYILRESMAHDFVEPAPGYVEAVAGGLEEFDLSDDALLAAAARKPISCFTSAIFAYGTLMRKQLRFDCLRQFDVQCALLAEAEGRLVDLGSYPALLPPDRAMLHKGEQIVEGDFIRLGNIAEALPELDAVEGFVGYGSESLFIRRLAPVEVGGRLRWAWVYEYNSSVDDIGVPISGGCWRRHRGELEDFLAELVAEHTAKKSGRAILECLAALHPFECGSATFPRSVKDLMRALQDGLISERRLAQASDRWTAAV